VKTYEHIPSNDTRCWCAPKLVTQEESVTREIFPGVFMAELRQRLIVIHFESSMAPRRHGKPARNKHLAEFVHV